MSTARITERLDSHSSDTPRVLLLTPRPATVLAVSVQDAAKMISVSTRTLATFTARGEVPSFLLGRRRLYSTEALAEFVRARTGGAA